MKKSVQISISPSKSGSGNLTIQDAMQQVWDFFELLSDEDNQHILWVLEDARFNSPLVITGKPIDIKTNELAYDVAEPVIRDIASAITNLSSLQSRPDNLSGNKLRKVSQLLERNTNGIEMTEYNFGNGIEPVTIDHNSAERSLKLLHQSSELEALMAPFAIQGYGSITGSLIQLGTYYNKPAIYVRDFNSGDDIWCQVDEFTITEMEEKIRAKEVWGRRDIRVRGMLDFDDKGKLTHIFDGQVSYLNRKQVSLDELHDPDFSEGLPSEEYIERLRED